MISFDSLKDQIIPEWQTMYLDMRAIRDFIYQFRDLPTNVSHIETENSESNILKFWEYFLCETRKSKVFYEYLLFLLQYKFEKYEEMMPYIDLQESQNIKRAMKLLYKECNLALKFANTNKKMVAYFKEKARSNMPKVYLESDRLKDSIENREFSGMHFGELKRLRARTLEKYMGLFPEREHALAKMQIAKFCKEVEISPKNVFLLGFFIGSTIVSILVLSFFMLLGNIKTRDDPEFIVAFPVFRGAFLFTCYFWFLAWNVWGWTQNQINYKKIFKFNFHSSSITDILKRAALFSSVLVGCFVVFCILRFTFDQNVSKEFLVISDIPPAIPWIFILVYIFIPLKIFNLEGRIYVFRLFKKILLFWKYPVTFPISWLSDQLVSLVRPMQDFIYFIFFYLHIFQSVDTHQIFSSKNLNVIDYVPFVPLLIRQIQCIKCCIAKGTLNCLDFLNFLKYTFAFATAFLSILYKLVSKNFLYLWIVSAISSSVYSFYWDSKNDWGFSNFKSLRKELNFDKPFVYFALFFNVLGRFFWMLSISQSIVASFDAIPEFFPLIVGLVEIFRRGMWNFLRVEKEHIINCENLDVIVLEFKNPKKYRNKLSKKRVIKRRDSEVNLISNKLESLLELEANQPSFPTLEKANMKLSEAKSLKAKCIDMKDEIIFPQGKLSMKRVYEMKAFS